jgi:magnesium-transporting ATPase (P-type)
MPEAGRKIDERRWFSIDKQEVLRSLSTSAQGISSEEATKRLGQFGPNVPVREKPRGPLYFILKQVNQPIIYVLLVAAAVTAYLAEWIDTAVILAVVVVNAIIGFIQESKAGRAIEELIRFSVTTAKVRRNGVQITLPANEIVPGDVIIMQAGDMVPADLRLILAKDLYVDESVFTGEAAAVFKQTDALKDMPLIPADQINMCFTGTLVVRGRGEGVAVTTGPNTELSKISLELKKTKKATFPMIKKIEELAKVLSAIVATAAVFTFGIGIVQGYEAVYMFRASVALAVAAIPEGLPALVTVVLASGVRMMARRNAIVRSLPAVEALGSTTVICSDKTGTLTMNKMTVVKVHAGGRDFAAEPPNYACVQHCDYPGPISIAQEPDLYETLAAGILCNDAVVVDGKAEGDPTETALILAANAAGVKPQLERIDEIPFETTLGYMATLHRDDRDGVIFVKGAPERIIAKCSRAKIRGKPAEIDSEALLDKTHEMARGALRVLAVATKRVASAKERIHEEDLDGLTFLGLVGMLDPPRPETKDAIASCHEAGIRVLMITGDHAATAEAIGKDLGLTKDLERVVTGQEIEALQEQDFARAVKEANIFARITPEHKLKITNQLVSDGEVVAVTGDGVNDTPALKAASIGVAMGTSGTDAAKEAADIVLRDDNFATIVAAVEEGRDIYNKVQRIIAWSIPTNIGEALMLLIAISLGIALPLLPLQILWINLVTAIALAIPLAFEPKEKGLLKKPPRSPSEGLITGLLIRKFVIVSSIMVLGTYGIFYAYQQRNESFALSQTVALNTLVFFEIFYLFNSRSLVEPAHTVDLRANPWLPIGVLSCLASQLLVTYWSPLNSVFQTEGIGLYDWLAAALMASSVFFAVEFEKVIANYRNANKSDH